MRRWTSRVLLAGSLLAALSGCDRPEAPARIVLASAPKSVEPLIQDVLDSLREHTGTDIRTIRLSDYGPPVDEGRPRYAELVEQVLQVGQDPQVIGLVGPPGSGEAVMVGAQLAGAGIPMLPPTANAPQLSSFSTAFPIAPPLDEEARLIVAFVVDELHARSVAVLYGRGLFGLMLQEAVSEELWMRGVTVTQRLPVGNSSGTCGAVDHVVGAALETRPDALVMTTHNPVTECVVRAAERLHPGLAYVVGDATRVDSALVQRIGPAARRLHAVTFLNTSADSAAWTAFRRAFERRHGRAPYWDEAASYDAVMLLATAVRTVGPDRQSVVRYLHQLGHARAPYRGVTGSIAFGRGPSDRLVIQAAAGAER